jgi:hypothetical protein
VLDAELDVKSTGDGCPKVNGVSAHLTHVSQRRLLTQASPDPLFNLNSSLVVCRHVESVVSVGEHALHRVQRCALWTWGFMLAVRFHPVLRTIDTGNRHLLPIFDSILPPTLAAARQKCQGEAKLGLCSQTGECGRNKVWHQSKRSQVLSLAILAVQLALLAFWSKTPITTASVPSAAIEVVAALAVTFLVAFEHQRIVHPSSLLWIYLLASVLSAAVQTRTLFIRGYVPTISRLTASSLACQIALLIVESTPKKSYLKPADHEFGPEELAGIFSRSIFWWLTPMLFLGNRKILKLSDLYPLDRNLRSKPLQERIVIEWEKRRSSKDRDIGMLTVPDKSPSPYSFVITSFVCFRWQVLRTVPPRMAITGFTYSQTFLINAAISYLETPAPLRNVNHAYGLIGATALIYSGIAVGSTGFS